MVPRFDLLDIASARFLVVSRGPRNRELTGMAFDRIARYHSCMEWLTKRNLQIAGLIDLAVSVWAVFGDHHIWAGAAGLVAGIGFLLYARSKPDAERGLDDRKRPVA